jgi:hypothetical protein
MALLLHSCGNGVPKNSMEGKVVTIYFYLPDGEHAEKEKYRKKLESTIIQNDAGEILQTDASKRTIETTIKLKNQESIDKIKHIFAKVSPETEYRIEGL